MCSQYIASSWNHDGDPVELLQINQSVSQFRQALAENPHFLQDKVRHYFKVKETSLIEFLYGVHGSSEFITTRQFDMTSGFTSGPFGRFFQISFSVPLQILRRCRRTLTDWPCPWAQTSPTWRNRPRPRRRSSRERSRLCLTLTERRSMTKVSLHNCDLDVPIWKSKMLFHIGTGCLQKLTPGSY